MSPEPTFLLGIGLSRAGSTWLADNLAAQSWTLTPKVKDLYFFDRNYERGADWYLDAFDRNATDHDLSQSAVRVDVSHDYFHSPFVPRRISETLGEQARCVLVLREPVGWLESQMRYGFQVGETYRTENGDLSLWLGTMVSGFFDRLLEPWRPMLENGQLMIVLFDDLVADGSRTLERIAHHVGRSPEQVTTAQSDTTSNGSALPRHPGAAKLSRLAGKHLRTVGAVDLLGAAKSNRLVRKALFRPASAGEELFSFSASARRELHEFYAPGVIALESDVPGIAARWGYAEAVDLSDRSVSVSVISEV